MKIIINTLKAHIRCTRNRKYKLKFGLSRISLLFRVSFCLLMRFCMRSFEDFVKDETVGILCESSESF